MAIVTVVALAGLYASGMWVPVSPWAVHVTQIEWLQNNDSWKTAAGFNVTGGSLVVVSVQWPLIDCGYNCYVRGPTAINSVSSLTPGFSVRTTNLPLNLSLAFSPIVLNVTLSTPWSDYAGDIQLNVQFPLATSGHIS